MAKDTRLYGKFTLNFPRHPKIAILSDAAFRCLVEATLYSRDELTDGLLARRYAVARWGLEVLQELCQNDDDNPSLIEVEKGWLIHDYADHQDTKAEVEARSARNKAAGQRGGMAKAKRGAKQVASESLSTFVAETETETETETDGGHLESAAYESDGSRERDDLSPPVNVGASRLVQRAIPANAVNAATRTGLRIEASQLLGAGESEADVDACLRLWLTKPDLGVKALKSLMAEVYKTRNGATAVPTSKVRTLAEMARQARAAEQTQLVPADRKALT